VKVLEGKTALITGAAGDIGRAIALKFAAAGADIAANDLSLMAAESVTEKVKEMGRRALPFEADVTDEGAVERMVEDLVAAWGKVDILVAGAGIRRDLPLEQMTSDDWQAVVDVSLKGCFHCVRAVQKHMTRRRFGKIIILSSPVPPGLRRPGNVHYSTASAGLMGLTVSLAVELGPYNITVNALAPDFIRSRMTRETLKKEGWFMEDFEKAALAHIPLRRLGTPEEVSRVALFLASDDSAFISGQVIHVRGGP
jgi:3-oxoacyl-[acyl-carrier protein] reductase